MTATAELPTAEPEAMEPRTIEVKGFRPPPERPRLNVLFAHAVAALRFYGCKVPVMKKGVKGPAKAKWKLAVIKQAVAFDKRMGLLARTQRTAEEARRIKLSSAGQVAGGDQQQTNDQDKPMFKTVIKYLQLGLDLLRADPADKEAIQSLQTQVATLNAELAQARAAQPSAEESSEINLLLAAFADIVPPVVVSDNVPAGSVGDLPPAPMNPPFGGSDAEADAAAPTTPYPEPIVGGESDSEYPLPNGAGNKPPQPE
jgi:hypothetical protein